MSESRPISASGGSSSPSLGGVSLETLAHLERELGSEGVVGLARETSRNPRGPRAASRPSVLLLHTD